MTLDKEKKEREREWTETADAFVRNLVDLRQSADIEEAVWRMFLMNSGLLPFDVSSRCSDTRPIFMSWLDMTLDRCSDKRNSFGAFDAKVLESFLAQGADPYEEDGSGTNAFGLWKKSGVLGASPRSYMDWRETLPVFAKYVDMCVNHNVSGNNGSAVESLARFAWPQALVLDDLEKVVGQESLRGFRSRKGMSLLFIACYEVDGTGVEWTLKRLGQDVNEMSVPDGLNPFHAVALGLSRYANSEHYDSKRVDAMLIVKRLLSADGDPSLKDAKGRVASEYAKDEELRILLEKESLMRKGRQGASRRRGSL